MFTVAKHVKRPIASVILSLLIVKAILVTNAVWAKETPWDLQRQDGSIRIYSRSVEGSAYLAIKATVLIDAPVQRVSQLMGNGNGCARWRAKCKSSKVLETLSEREQYIYMVLDLPWPASDRDIVVHSSTEIDAQARTATVKLESVSSRHPSADYVRAESSGQFVIREIHGSQVEFTYIMHTDLGGDLPAGMVNSGLAEAAFDDLHRLQQLAEE